PVPPVPGRGAVLTRETPTVWSPAQRIWFRFAFCYFLLLLVPFPLGWIPYTEPAYELYAKLWHAIIPWVGDHVLGFDEPITTFTNGSGDTTYDWVFLLVTVVLAAVAAPIWSFIDRRRLAYPRLHDRLRIYVRFALGIVLMSYGLAKVVKTQFPFPGPERLVQPYGESSPMGLLWTFMGYSTAYNVFTGGAEVLAGALMFFRRTTTLGALLSIAVMSNIVM